MSFDEFCKAVDDAKQVARRGDRAAEQLGALLVGRLRHVSAYDPGQLKRELRDFDLRSCTWKD